MTFVSKYCFLMNNESKTVISFSVASPSLAYSISARSMFGKHCMEGISYLGT